MDPLSSLLQQIEFHEKFRGYDPVEVDAYVDRVTIAAAELKRRIQELEAGVESAEAAAATAVDDGSSPTEETMKRTLVLAQRTADAAIAEANERAEQIMAEAEVKARRRVAEVEQRSISLMTDAEHRSTAILKDSESRSGIMVAEAEAEHFKIVNGARSEAARITIEQRERNGSELRELEAAREGLSNDVAALVDYLAAARANLVDTSSKLADLVAEPKFLHTDPVPVISRATVPQFLNEEPPVIEQPAAIADPVFEVATEDSASDEILVDDGPAMENESVGVEEPAVEETAVEEPSIEEDEPAEQESPTTVAFDDPVDPADPVEPESAPEPSVEEAGSLAAGTEATEFDDELAYRRKSLADSIGGRRPSVVWAPDDELEDRPDEPEFDVETLLADAGIEDEAPYVAFFSDDDEEADPGGAKITDRDDTKNTDRDDAKITDPAGSSKTESRIEDSFEAAGISLGALFGVPTQSRASESRVERAGGEAPIISRDAPVEAVASDDAGTHLVFERTPPVTRGLDPEIITDESENSHHSDRPEVDEPATGRKPANDAFLAELNEKPTAASKAGPNDDALSAFFEDEDDKGRRWFGRGR